MQYLLPNEPFPPESRHWTQLAQILACHRVMSSEEAQVLQADLPESKVQRVALGPVDYLLRTAELSPAAKIISRILWTPIQDKEMYNFMGPNLPSER